MYKAFFNLENLKASNSSVEIHLETYAQIRKAIKDSSRR
jgi:hypothetical protein